MTNRPARIPPGRHPNLCGCQGCRRDIAEFEAGQWRGTPIAAAILAAIGGAVWLAVAMARAWHAYALLALAVPVMLVPAFLALRAPRKPGPRPVPSGVAEAVKIADELEKPPPPVCLHRNAVRVGSMTDPAVTLCCWCPDCEAGLDAGFRWSCCGGPPGDSPGDGHMHNCPQAAEWAP